MTTATEDSSPRRMFRSTPLSLRVSLTDRCQFRCRYCRPAHPVRPSSTAVDPPAVWLRRICAVCRAARVAKIRFTGGEPLLYAQLKELVAGCAELGVADLAVTTNGFRLAATAEGLRAAGLRRVNISLDSLDPQVFRHITGAPGTAVLEGISAALAAGLSVKLNAVVMRGVNDACLLDLLAFAAHRQVPIRFLEMMPIGPAAAEFQDLYLSGEEMMEQLRGQVALEPLPYESGETSRDFVARWPDGRTARCGFILPASTPFCQGCRRLRFASDGTMVGCLAQPDRFDVAAAVDAAHEGDVALMRQVLAAALAIKQRPQAFEAQAAMVRVGG